MSEKSERPSVTAPLYAFIRQGHKEIGQVLQAFPDSIRVVEEPGTLGNPTPQMVTEQIQPNASYDQFLDRYSSRSDVEHSQDRGLER